ncbi:putative ankyrin repeat protein RF_0381 [Leptopilina heterotoma]|uniref:putative ankyrin repeat protein RF_0381 n=1 Tax=Leptopilina heterotoma TaxID=63436 RepID=UPI001CA9F783|nr:putative ankyrin repeat protein RF_0381 [Leptopilina heterotoma]
MSSIEIQSLQNACFSGDEGTVKNILSQNNFNNYLASSSGYSLLCSMLKNSVYSSQRHDELQVERAMYEQHLAKFLEISKLLLQHPVKINDESQERDHTPLHFAVEIGNLEIVKILLTKGAIVNATNNNSDTPLHIAVSEKNNPSESVIQLLLENGADVKIQNKLTCTPYDLSVNSSIKRILSQHEIKMLLNSDWAIEKKDFEGYTSLHRAVDNDRYDLVEFLLSRGFDVNAETEFKETPLHFASEMRHEEITLLLLQAGANINATSDTKNTPLHLAVDYKPPESCAEFLEMLVNNGANLTAKNDCGLIPLDYAIDNNSLIEATILLGKNPNNCDMSLKMSFCHSFLAPFFGSVNGSEIFKEYECKTEVQLISELFYNHGFRITTEDIKNMPIPERFPYFNLTRSTMKESRSIVQELLNKEETSCEEKMRQDLVEYYVLIGVIKYGFIDIFYNLLPNVSNFNTCLLDGLTLLHHACGKGHLIIVKELLARGANVNGGENKFSPLHVSVKYNFVEITKTLLTKDVNINSCNNYNETPLFVAVSEKSFKCIQLLLEAGADVNFSHKYKNYGSSVLKKNINITKLLLHYGATYSQWETEPLFEFSTSFPSTFHPHEVEEMKNMKIGESDVTVYDLLTMSHRRLSILMRNENFLHSINSLDFETLFPNFAPRFEVHVNKAKLEKRLIELSYDCFQTMVKFQLPILVMNEIISYLNTADLHRLVIASPIKSEMKKTVQFQSSE